MENLRRPFVVRVTGFGTNDREQAKTILQSTICNRLTNNEREALSESFSVCVVPSCNNVDSCDAIVDFKAGLPLPIFLSELKHKPLKSISIQIDDNAYNYLTFDCHFHGFTQLYPIPDGKPINADIIAITGLDGHAYGSWTSKSFPWPMWLRHFLSRDLPQCRTMIYGYNAKLSEYNFTNITQYCQEFLQLVRPVRMNEARRRPVFFISHSFGGIILARSLVKAHQITQETDITIAALFPATYAIVFFAVPHYGIVVDDMMKMLGPGHPREELLKELSSGQNSLGEQLEHFINIIQDRKIVSFVEAQQTKRLKQNSESGKWERSGKHSTVLPYDGAILKLPERIEQIYTIHQDHSMLVKFFSNTVSPYKVVLQFLREFEQDAPEIVRKRFCYAAITTRPAASTIPFGRDANFVGRRNIINAIVSLFKKQNRVGIYGLGAIGKSQIAIEYAYQLRDSDPDTHLFWIHASNPARYLQSFRDIAKGLALAGRDADQDILDLVARWLKEEHNGHWLLILDNADDLDVLLTKHGSSDSTTRLIDFIPDVSHGRVLVTSRVKSTARFIVGYENLQAVREMDNIDSLQLVKSCLVTRNQVTDEEAKQLLEKLEGHPLAISQACAYLNQNALVTIQTYIESISQDGNELLRRPWFDLRRDKDAPNAVIDSLELSVRHICEHFPQAAEVLSAMSMFDRHKIPKFFIQLYRQTNDKSGLWPISKKASPSPGLTKTSSSPLVRIKKALKQWKRSQSRRRSPASESLSLGHEGLAELSGHDSREPPTGDDEITYSNDEFYSSSNIDKIGTDEALNHLLDFSLIKVVSNDMFEMHSIVQMAIKAWHQGKNKLHIWQNLALNIIANFVPRVKYENWTTWKVLLPHIAAVIADQQHGTSDKLVHILSYSAWYLRETGNYELSVKRAVWSLEIMRGKFGENHPRTLNYMSNLASTYWYKGQWKEAEELGVQVVEIRKRVLGQKHPDTLTSMANLASIYRSQGRGKESEELEVKVVKGRKRVLGQEHPAVLKSMADLATSYYIQGRLKETEELSIRVVEKRKRVLGQEHPDTQASMADLSLAYQNQGRWKEAEKLVVEMLEMKKRVFGQEDQNTLTSMNDLAYIVKSQDRNEEAIMLIDQCANFQKRILGIEHPDTQRSLLHLEIWQSEAADAHLNCEDQDQAR